MHRNGQPATAITITINPQTTFRPVGNPKPSRLRVARSRLLPLAIVASAVASPWTIPVTVKQWEHNMRATGQLLKMDWQELRFAAGQMARETSTRDELR
jgi:hypothetical protein